MSKEGESRSARCGRLRDRSRLRSFREEKAAKTVDGGRKHAFPSVKAPPRPATWGFLALDGGGKAQCGLWLLDPDVKSCRECVQDDPGATKNEWRELYEKHKLRPKRKLEIRS